MPFEKIIRKRASDLVYAALRAAIVSGELAPGEQIIPKAVADQLGVSNTPVRVAFDRLEVEGLINSYHSRGTYVKRRET